MPHILITNDDGYQSPGLGALARALAGIGKVTVFAPDHNWSAAGHAKTMHKPLRVAQGVLDGGFPLFITSGTPSDCVSLALLGMVPDPVDLVVSGINHGSNLGHDVTYSGTLAAAMEAAVSGLPAIAASQDYTESFGGDLDFAARVVTAVAQRVLTHGLPPEGFLNLNFPAVAPETVRGILVTRLGKRTYPDVLIERVDPKGQPYYWIGGEPPEGQPEDGTDIGALANGYVSLSPLKLDMTDLALMGALQHWDLNLP